MGRHPHLGTFELEGPSDLALARDALAATGTDHLAGRAYMTLSGGEKQRVVIASALTQSPDVLLLDEPTASLDLGYQLEVAALLRRLNRDRGVTMVLATHDLNLAASLCDRLILMRDGRVVAQGADARRADRRVDPAHLRRRRRRELPRRRRPRDRHAVEARAMSRHATRARRRKTRARDDLARVVPSPIRTRLAEDRRRIRRAARRHVRARAARGQLADQPGARVRSFHSLQRERGRADLLRRADAARRCGCPGRRRPGGCGRRLSGVAAQCAGDAVHARRVRRRVSRRDARHRAGGDGQRWDRSQPCRWPASLAPRSPPPSSTGWRRCRTARCPRRCCCWQA